MNRSYKALQVLEKTSAHTLSEIGDNWGLSRGRHNLTCVLKDPLCLELMEKEKAKEQTNKKTNQLIITLIQTTDDGGLVMEDVFGFWIYFERRPDKIC